MQFVFKDEPSHLLHLISFSLPITQRLQIDDLFNPFLVEYMMICFHSLRESQIPQELSQRFKSDVPVGQATENFF